MEAVSDLSTDDIAQLRRCIDHTRTLSTDLVMQVFSAAAGVLRERGVPAEVLVCALEFAMSMELGAKEPS